MKEQLIELLKTFNFPVRLQGSLTEDESYPTAFFTFWNNETDDESFYDNNPIRCVWSFSVNFYSTNPELINTILTEARELLRKNGWIVMGKGYDVPSDEASHTGRGMDVLYVENYGG